MTATIRIPKATRIIIHTSVDEYARYKGSRPTIQFVYDKLTNEVIGLVKQ